MEKLTQEQLIELAKSGNWKTLNKEHKKQFMNFMFGAEFMESKDKGKKKQYRDE